MFSINVHSNPWIMYVKKSLEDLGLSYICDCQGEGINKSSFTNIIKYIILDI